MNASSECNRMHRHRRQSGLLVLGAAAGLSVMAALSTAMLSTPAAVQIHEGRVSNGERAQYLADSGYFHALSVERAEGFAAAMALDGREFVLPSGGSFALEVTGSDSFQFELDTTQSLNAPGGDLTGVMAIPAGESLQRFDGQFQYLGVDYRYQEFVAGTNMLRGVTRVDGANPSVTFAANAPLLAPPRVEIRSTGRFPDDASPVQAVRTLSYAAGLAFPDFTGGRDLTINDIDDVQRIFIMPDSGTPVSVQDTETQHGDVIMVRLDNLVETYTDPETNLTMGAEFLCLNPDRFSSGFRDAWNLRGGRSEYDAQVKQKWGWAELYGATGISFRWHPVGNGQYQGYGISFMRYRGNHPQDIAIWDKMPNTLKPYPTPRHPEFPANCSQFNNRNCPLLHTWFQGQPTPPLNIWGADRLNEFKNLHTLMVLWEQYINNAGQPVRRWLAYKDMGMVALLVYGNNWLNYEKQTLEYWGQPGGLVIGDYEYDEYLLGLQPDWEFDGIYINDLSSIGVRIEEDSLIGVTSLTFSNVPVAGAEGGGGSIPIATITTTTRHHLSPGDPVVISGATPSGYNGRFSVLFVENPTRFVVQLPMDPGASPATGPIVLDGGSKRNRVKIFYGDASTYYWPPNSDRSTTNTIPYDNEELRSRRNLTQDIADANNQPWPAWPPEDLGALTNAEDAFTVLGELAGHPRAPRFAWTEVRSDLGFVDWEAPDTLLLRRYTSPTLGDGAAWENRNELCLHVFGNFKWRDLHSPDPGNEYAAFTDFLARFISTGGHVGGGWSSGGGGGGTPQLPVRQ